MKKTSRDIHPRNIPTNFEKNPNIGCRVRGVDGRTDRPTAGFFFYTNFFFNVGNSMKREENLKYLKRPKLFYFFQYLKNS